MTTIVQIDAPLHDLTDWRVWTTPRHAVGYLDGNPVTVVPHAGEYRISLFQGYDADVYAATAPTFAAAVDVVHAARFFHDPAVAFTIAGSGSAGLAEVLEAEGGWSR